MIYTITTDYTQKVNLYNICLKHFIIDGFQNSSKIAKCFDIFVYGKWCPGSGLTGLVYIVSKNWNK